MASHFRYSSRLLASLSDPTERRYDDQDGSHKKRQGSDMRLALNIVSSALVVSSLAFGQSLGEVARDNREKQKAKSASSSAKPKVITNETLPASPDAEPSEAERITTLAPRDISGNRQPAGPSAAEWKSSILQQKSAIAAQQAQIDKLNASIHFVPSSLYANGLQYDEYQLKKQQAVARMQEQLEEQKKNLAQMQEAARQAAMGSAVYEP
jgi:hypothetical protein